uniref:Ig-like domain-containing protein n=1 Tax=Alkalihalobacillus deserti TaxID=2879466 RepID=UPI001D136272
MDFRKVFMLYLALILIIQPLLVTLSAGDKVLAESAIELSIEDREEGVVVTEANYSVDGSKLTVTGTVENKSTSKKVIGLMAVGLDENNNPVEVASDYSKGTFGGVQVAAGSSQSFTATLENKAEINKIHVKATGNSTEVELLGFGVIQKDHQIIVTGVIENGLSQDQMLTMDVVTYDGQDNEIEHMSVDSLNWMDRAGTVKPGEPSNLKIVIDDPTVRKVKIDTVEQINSSTNVVTTPDISGPLVSETLPQGGVVSKKVPNEIKITFNEAIVRGPEFNSISVSGLMDIELTVDSHVLSIKSSEALDFNSTYTVFIPKSAVRDVANNELVEDYSFEFLTTQESKKFEDFYIITGNETLTDSQSYDKTVIIAPHVTLTVNSGASASFNEGLIVYGTLTNNGNINVSKTVYANKYSVFSGDLNYPNFGVIDGSGSASLSGLVVSASQYPAPPLTIIEPSDESVVTKQSVDIIGYTVPGFEVSINETSVTANSAGEFKINRDMEDGNNTFIINGKDVFAQEFSLSKLSLTSVTLPQTPEVDEVTDQSTAVTGQAEAGSTVTVKAGENVLGSAVVKADGTYHVEIAKQAAGTQVEVTATDEAGHVSE